MTRLSRILLAAAVFLLIGVVGWWVLRWQAGVEVYGLVQNYLHGQLGLSRAQAAVVGLGAGVFVAVMLTLLAIKTRVLLGIGVIGLALGVPAAFLHDRLAADQCMDPRTNKSLCAVWQLPDGGMSIRREDAARPPSTWRRLRTASQEDVLRYSGTPEEQAERLPKRLAFDSCATVSFFENGRARVYYTKGLDGEIEFWDRPGTHSKTNAPFRQITPQIVEQVCKHLDDIARAKREKEEALARAKAEEERMRAEAEREAAARALAQDERKEADARRASELAQQRQVQRERELAAEVERPRQQDDVVARLNAARQRQEDDVAGRPLRDSNGFAAVHPLEGAMAPASRRGQRTAPPVDAPHLPSATGSDPLQRVRIR